MKVSSEDEDTEALPSELALVLLDRVGGEVAPHLPLDAGLDQIGPADRHRPAVDLDHEIAARAVSQSQPEDEVGNDTEIVAKAAMRDANAKRERIALAERLIRERGDHLVGVNEPQIIAPLRGALHRDIEVHDLKLVFDERPAGFPVLAAPLDVGEVDAVAFDEKAGAAVGECVHHRARSGGRVVVELGARTVEVAGMEEPGQTIVGAIEGAANKRGDVGRSEEAVAGKLAHDRHVIVRQTKCGWRRRAAKPGPAQWQDCGLYLHGDNCTAERRPASPAGADLGIALELGGGPQGRYGRDMAASDRIARLRVQLDDIEPAIWRRIEVPLTISLKSLHDAIQAVMGWQDAHLYEFEVGDKHYGVPDPEWDRMRAVLNAKSAKLAAVIDRGVRTFAYVYDFGDNWRHTVTVEAVADGDPRAAYPRFLDGARRAARPRMSAAPRAIANSSKP